MLDHKKVAEIIEESRAYKWPFPKTFQALKEAGVTSYEVFLSPNKSIYYGENGSYEDTVQQYSLENSVADNFDENLFKSGLLKHQSEKTPYSAFLNDAARAGVNFYKVDMLQKTVTYFGKNREDSYTEIVPV